MRTQRARFQAYRGRQVRVFAESLSERDDRIVLGRTMHGMPVSFEGGEDLLGSNVPVEIDESTAYGMAGRRIATPDRAD